MPNLVATGPVATPRSEATRHRPYIGLAVTADALAWATALVLAVLLRVELDVDEIDLQGLAWTAGAAAATQVLAGVARRSYTADSAISARGAGGLTASVFLVGLVVFALALLTDQAPVPRSTPLTAIPIAALMLVGSRAWLRAWSDRPDLEDPRRTRRAIVVGSGDDAEYIVRSMLRDPGWGILPVAVLAEGGTRRRRIAGIGAGRPDEDLAVVAQRHSADLLIVATTAPDRDETTSLTTRAGAAGLAVLVVPPIADLIRSLAPIDPPETSARPLHPASRPDSAARAAAKRFLDVGLCLIALPVVLPVLIGVALTLLCTGGEVLYRAPRVGLQGRTFTMLKFATMRPGDSGPRVTRENDSRITPIGRVLRTTKLNELPQVINVLRGDMSVVGPRPEDPRYARSYSTEQRAVWSVRPGMTSTSYLEFGDEEVYIERARPVDIEAFYVAELLPAKLEIELRYVRNWTVLGDIMIMARTLRLLLVGRSSGKSTGTT